MKNTTFKKEGSAENLFEVVVPLPGKESEADEDGLYDDCPLCQELKRMKERGEVEIFEGEE